MQMLRRILGDFSLAAALMTAVPFEDRPELVSSLMDAAVDGEESVNLLCTALVQDHIGCLQHGGQHSALRGNGVAPTLVDGFIVRYLHPRVDQFLGGVVQTACALPPLPDEECEGCAPSSSGDIDQPSTTESSEDHHLGDNTPEDAAVGRGLRLCLSQLMEVVAEKPLVPPTLASALQRYQRIVQRTPTTIGGDSPTLKSYTWRTTVALLVLRGIAARLVNPAAALNNGQQWSKAQRKRLVLLAKVLQKLASRSLFPVAVDCAASDSPMSSTRLGRTAQSPEFLASLNPLLEDLFDPFENTLATAVEQAASETCDAATEPHSSDDAEQGLSRIAAFNFRRVFSAYVGNGHASLLADLHVACQLQLWRREMEWLGQAVESQPSIRDLKAARRRWGSFKDIFQRTKSSGELKREESSPTCGSDTSGSTKEFVELIREGCASFDADPIPCGSSPSAATTAALTFVSPQCVVVSEDALRLAHTLATTPPEPETAETSNPGWLMLTSSEQAQAATSSPGAESRSPSATPPPPVPEGPLKLSATERPVAALLLARLWLMLAPRCGDSPTDGVVIIFARSSSGPHPQAEEGQACPWTLHWFLQLLDRLPNSILTAIQSVVYLNPPRSFRVQRQTWRLANIGKASVFHRVTYADRPEDLPVLPLDARCPLQLPVEFFGRLDPVMPRYVSAQALYTSSCAPLPEDALEELGGVFHVVIGLSAVAEPLGRATTAASLLEFGQLRHDKEWEVQLRRINAAWAAAAAIRSGSYDVLPNILLAQGATRVPAHALLTHVALVVEAVSDSLYGCFDAAHIRLASVSKETARVVTQSLLNAPDNVRGEVAALDESATLRPLGLLRARVVGLCAKIALHCPDKDDGRAVFLSLVFSSYAVSSRGFDSLGAAIGSDSMDPLTTMRAMTDAALDCHRQEVEEGRREAVGSTAMLLPLLPWFKQL